MMRDLYRAALAAVVLWPAAGRPGGPVAVDAHQAAPVAVQAAPVAVPGPWHPSPVPAVQAAPVAVQAGPWPPAGAPLAGQATGGYNPPPSRLRATVAGILDAADNLLPWRRF
jgi:hypothetical protein